MRCDDYERGGGAGWGFEGREGQIKKRDETRGWGDGGKLARTRISRLIRNDRPKTTKNLQQGSPTCCTVAGLMMKLINYIFQYKSIHTTHGLLLLVERHFTIKTFMRRAESMPF